MKNYSAKQFKKFKDFIWQFYKEHGRSFPWRHETDPYRVLVSEIMLQQTQTKRVAEKYELFIAEFPTVQSLAMASLRDVLSVWQGLGYNRRAKFLHQAGYEISCSHNNQVPSDFDTLISLPGIGKNTAGSIAAFAFNIPSVFIETNIRAVFIHYFFREKIDIDDKEILPLVAQTVDLENPREWYYALMDYGVYLKKSISNPSRKSKHHLKQSKFEGSDRQIRGNILRILTNQGALSKEELLCLCACSEQRFSHIVNGLVLENMVLQSDDLYRIA